jgi:fatty-acyl-CoA synthase
MIESQPTPKLSAVRGARDAPLCRDTIGAAFHATVARQPGALALVSRHQGVRWSYRELADQVDALASGLSSLGLGRGDRVGIWSPNCAEWIVTQLATAQLGVILTTINPAYRPGELRHALNLSGCAMLIAAERFKSSDYIAMIDALAPELGVATPGALHTAQAPELRWVVNLGTTARPGMLRFFDLLEQGRAADAASHRADLSPDDPINIQFTSGTTGLPKAATLSHASILNNGLMVGCNMQFGPADRLCLPVPLYHCFGMVMGVLNCILHGAAMVLPSDAFEPEAVLQAVEAERCTALYGVPTMFIAELACPRFAEFDLSSLRAGIMAGAPCPAELMRAVMADMHMRDIVICYGMTETSPVSFQTSLESAVEQRVSTVGRILPHLEARVVSEDGRVLPLGERGELLVRGYSVMLGYWNEPDRTHEAIDAEGWMHTGDLATIDADGYCRIVGRCKDMIIRGGENIYPAEIEHNLREHPDIINAAVFGVPDPLFGEIVCAWLICAEGRAPTEQQIVAFCRERLAHYKVPQIVRFVSEFPMTVTGKIQKFEMRNAMAPSQ